MQIQRQADLLRHRHHGIQRDGWILEHHAHVAAAQIGHGLVGGADGMRAIQIDVAAHPRRFGKDAHHGLGDHRFAGTGRSDQSDAFAVRDGQFHIMHDRIAVDGDIKVVNMHAHAMFLNAGFVNGSMASRSASPKRFSAMTTTVTTRPGQSTAVG